MPIADYSLLCIRGHCVEGCCRRHRPRAARRRILVLRRDCLRPVRSHREHRDLQNGRRSPVGGSNLTATNAMLSPIHIPNMGRNVESIPISPATNHRKSIGYFHDRPVFRRGIAASENGDADLYSAGQTNSVRSAVVIRQMSRR